jgi:hypothetical protein
VRKRRPDQPIEPALFNFIRDYATEVLDAAQRQPVPRVSLGPLSVFIENFFGQFFNAAFKIAITDFSERSQERAAKTRLRREKQTGPDETTRLISSFETYCKLHPDIANERSPEADDDDFDQVAEELVGSFLPTLLDRIEAWAEATGAGDITRAVQSARDHLETATAELGFA